ncbi:MAG: ABC transporter permease subunit [Planctomycetota bacterium]
MSARFLSGFAASFGRALRGALPGKKALILLVVLAVPPLLTAAAGTQADSEREIRSGYFYVVFFLYLQFLAPLSALLFGTEILLAESTAGTLPYLFTRPVPRASILLGKYVAYLIVGALALATSLAATLAVYAGPPLPEEIPLRSLLAVVAVYPAYLAAFAFLSAFTKWSLMAGFLYAFGLEFFLGIIPGMIRKGTMLYYSHSLLGRWECTPVRLKWFFGEAGPASVPAALMTLGAVTLIALLLTAWIVRRREFVERNPGRA